MPNPSFHFFQLQKIDLKIDAIQKRLSEIIRLRNDNARLKSLTLIFSDKTSILEELRKTNISTEEDALKRKMKIEQSEASLYSGTIKNPKELQDLQAEIKSLKSALSTLEDLQLQQMLDIESAEAVALAAKTEVESCESQLQVQFSSLIAEEKTALLDLEKISQERQVVVEQLNTTDLTTYNTLRKNKNGHAVSQVEEGSCSVCGQTLTPSEFQIARSPSQMAFCPSCNRLLYAG